MKITAVIDRFEGDKAVLLLRNKEKEIQDEIPVIWPRKLLPKAKEGLILNISLEADKAATQNALAENETLLKQILAQQKQDR